MIEFWRLIIMAIIVSIIWYLPAKAHHNDMVRACKEVGHVKESIFGDEIKCKEMEKKND